MSSQQVCYLAPSRGSSSQCYLCFTTNEGFLKFFQSSLRKSPNCHRYSHYDNHQTTKVNCSSPFQLVCWIIIISWFSSPENPVFFPIWKTEGNPLLQGQLSPAKPNVDCWVNLESAAAFACHTIQIIIPVLEDVLAIHSALLEKPCQKSVKKVHMRDLDLHALYLLFLP